MPDRLAPLLAATDLAAAMFGMFAAQNACAPEVGVLTQKPGAAESAPIQQADLARRRASNRFKPFEAA